MRDVPLTTVSLEGGVAAALAAIPAKAGVGQIVGPEGRSLVIGRPSNLRRWAATNLGAGRPRKGSRPPTDLSPVAAAVRHAVTASTFRQRLVYERLMAPNVPLAARRDLRAPAYLHLDPAERFPRITVRPGPSEDAALYGPFRDRRAAERARHALHKLFPLRPCDYVFEPHPELPLGLSCVYFQLQACAAPCVARVTEPAYRALAAEAAAFLARPDARPPAVEEWLPSWVSRVEGSRGLVVEVGKAGVELYPVRDGAVLEEESVTTSREDVRAALARLSWDAAAAPRDDRPWLCAWLRAPRRTGAYLVVAGAKDAAGLEARVLKVLGP